MSQQSKYDKKLDLYENSFMEALTRSPYWLPPVIFVPVILYFVYDGLARIEVINILIVNLLGISGFVAWTLLEYVIHRFVFHHQPTSKSGKRLIFILHGVHHACPNDLGRLVFPVTASVPLSVACFYLIKTMPWTSDGYNSIFFAFFILGYLTYDMIHYASHAVTFKNGILATIQKNHLRHHFSNPYSRYGISSEIWDLVFRTSGRKK